MSGQQPLRLIRRELGQMMRDGVIDQGQYQRLVALYPEGSWNWIVLARWLTLFGAISAVAGAVILLREYFTFTFLKVGIGLCLLTFLLLGLGQVARRRAMSKLALAIELMAGIALIGMTFAFAVHFSNGSGNWPAVLLMDLPVLLALSYGLRNPLMLILSVVVFFVWFGGRTGYESGWGMYWFGMNYPLRFLLAAMWMVGLGALHLTMERRLLAAYGGFAKIWISSGLFMMEMALWLLTLFGNFGDMTGYYHAAPGERGMFTLLWLALNVVLMVLGRLWRFGMLSGYGLTFMIIALYTLYFQYVAEHIGWVVNAFIVGGSAIAVVIGLESLRRGRSDS